ncbi:MAG: xylulokinase [Spirochaetaceae bacterium]
MHLGIDLGSGSIKLLLVDREGREWESSASYPIASPEPGYAETDTERWLEAFASCLKRLPDLAGLRSIGLCGQMHGIVPVSISRGEAVYPCITWADSRGRGYLPRLEGQKKLIAEAIRNRPAAGMAATTLLWLKEQRREILSTSDLVLFPKDFIRWELTGNLGTDRSDASGSLLYDFRSRSWSKELLSHLEIERSLLPPIAGSLELAGRVCPEAARRYGLPEGCPVAFGAGDTPAAMYGADLLDPTVVQVSVGTAAQVGRATPELPAYHEGLNLFEGVSEGVRYRIAAMLNGGLALEWMRRTLSLDWDELYRQVDAQSLSPSRELHFLPYLSGERTPYMNPEARGAWTGLALNHTRLDIALAALVGVAESVRLGLETLGTEGVEQVRLVGGSARYTYWARLLATVLSLPVSRCDAANGSARGAARIGAAAVGEQLNFEESLSPVEPLELPWIEEHYRRFLELYRRLHAPAL